MWNILKQEKDQYESLIKDITYINEASDELSLHHDYRLVQQLTDYIKAIGNPDMSGDKMINIVTQEEISPFNTEYLLNCFSFGEKLLQDFNHERLDLKTVSLFATISLKYVPTNFKQHASKIYAVKELSKDVETNKATRYLEYAIFRGKTHDMNKS